jgi:hypothetical protein
MHENLLCTSYCKLLYVTVVQQLYWYITGGSTPTAGA